MKCILCRNNATRTYLLGKYQLCRCNSCGFGWPDPLPTDDELARFYSTHGREHLADSDLNQPEHQRISRTLRRLNAEARTLLDVGCGFGQLLDAAREQGFDTCGLDVNDRRVAHTAARGHRTVLGTLTPDVLRGEQFDVVILSHVIEHLRDPAAMLRSIHQIMRPGGILYVGCPNFAGIHATIAGAHYHHYSPPEHISYFTVDSLKRCAEAGGFHPLRIGCWTHTLHAKALLAHLAYLRFARPAAAPRVIRDGHSARRFIEGRAAAIKIPLYQMILGVSWLLRPLINAGGGDHIESYWRAAA
jgi:SAM-dependent methyltransferase